MWFVFPQVAGLGHSEMAKRYAISGIAEARAYLEHTILGPRLRECASALTRLTEHRPGLGLRLYRRPEASVLTTLFPAADPGEKTFAAVLEKYFGGERDEGTISRL